MSRQPMRPLHSLRPTLRSAVRLALSLVFLAACALPAGAAVLVIDGGTVHPVSGEAFVGRVVVDGSSIVAAGPDVAIPAGAEVIDAAGRHVYPGLFDAFGQVGLVEINSVAATDDESEMGEANPHLRSATAVHPASEVIPVTRTGGITQAVIAPLPSRGGLIAGQAGLFDLDGWTVEDMAIEPSLAMVVQWPEIVTRRFDFATFSVKETPYAEAKETAEKQVEELRGWLQAARHYRQASAAGSRRLERDLKLEALADVFDGLPVMVLADRKQDIESAVKFAEDEGLRMILCGGADAWQVASLLAEKNLPVILGLTQRLPSEEDEEYDQPFHAPSILVEAGVQIAFASGAGGGDGPGGPHGARTVPLEAGMATGYGLSADDALRAVTLWPARILGVDDRFGSIEPGKHANLIVTDGDPTELTTQVLELIIDGRLVPLDNRHLALYETYQAR